MKALEPVGHETKPPSRYTEASLVKMLEEEGIGRPSTYASIISTIQRRGYVRKEGSALVPTFTAFATNNLMEAQFNPLVDVHFTAEMEEMGVEVVDSIADLLAKVDCVLLETNDGPHCHWRERARAVSA